MRNLVTIAWMWACLTAGTAAWAQQTVVVVDGSGRGDFTSIQAAINSLSDSSAQPRLIRILPGTYTEKIYITKHNIILRGEDRDKTLISQSIARDEWRCYNPDDWGTATLNLKGNDITLENLTIANDYGFIHTESREVLCPADTASRRKTISPRGHQMAIRTWKTTRLKAINCHFKAYGGDTVSPWNTEDGLFYFKDCLMEGGVDFYCPRGWAWAENCTFYAHTGTASIWHDGSGNADSKTVLVNCRFEGFEGFQLGRYHRDAQFYLINCHFSKNMADKDIYQVPTDNTIAWGRRVYYANCHRQGGDYPWFADNLHRAPGAPRINDISPTWLFKEMWQLAEAQTRASSSVKDKENLKRQKPTR